MNILYIGDIMAEPGMSVVESILPKLKRDKKIDVVIAQAENVTDGRGISAADYKKLLKLGVDFCTGGNWTLNNKEIWPYLEKDSEPIIRPANYPEGTPGKGFKQLKVKGKNILVVSLMGHIVGKDSDVPLDNPLLKIDEILTQHKSFKFDAIIVNFHGDFSSEKVIIGHYLDGRVSAVIGDHWHVPTADARILAKQTAHITDVGMCGALDSSLGISYASVIPRWRDNLKTRNTVETNGPKQFNGVIIKTDDSYLASSIEQIRIVQD